ncbi:acyl carrier protein [Streptococcus macacae]|uniref:Acyl carrier protein n=1 Tax=Streptococcus macacae NCTC 11558 TaxID=764298 RepID=G5JXM3_9STRE|nr:acyl carrier protein [Streptococcus macacae]EHJ52680.1 putative acyl carrier protein [Streptococcus macacae NCTC 11558]SUN77581.1 acyl carrier protein [Streptococcus macacae NCTC 11558]
MTEDEIFTKISTTIKEQLNNKDLVITKDTNIQDDLNVDSIALMEFVISLEDEFNLTIPDEDVEAIQSMGEMTTYLSHRLKE